MSLDLKYRPKDFEYLLGNEENIEILKNFTKNPNRPHTYLFFGHRGCGKTTMARIFANKLDSDLIELNGSDNRGIDDIRQIIQSCQFKTLNGKNKCYLIDEVHKLTNEAQNSFLKILEEPPEHIYFFLCTTDPQKLLPTIKSRCSLIQIEKIDNIELTRYIESIAKKEGKEIDRKICRTIAKTSEGCVRDALKILESVLQIEDEEKQLKIASQKIDNEEVVIDLCRELLKPNNWKACTKILKGLKEDPEKIRRTILGYMSSVLLNSREGNMQAGLVIECLEHNVYDSGFPGLIYRIFKVFL